MAERLQSIPDCVLCGGREKQVKIMTDFLGPYSKDLGVYVESEHFLVAPDLHPVVDDPYFLVFPRAHYTSFKLIPAEWDREMHEIGLYLAGLGSKSSVIIFEHGQMLDGNKVKSVYHAHTHVILTDEANILSRVEASIGELGGRTVPVEFDSYGSISVLREKVEGDYLLFRQDGRGLYVVDDGKTMDIPSQYFRVLLQSIYNPLSRFVNWKSMSDNERNIFKRRLVNFPRRT